VFGWSGSGKTTLMEAVLPTLVARGLRVAVMKSDMHGLNVDHPGKDSDRLFRAGADVLLGGPGEGLFRTHRTGAESLAGGLATLLSNHDLVLVEGNRSALIPKVWLASETEPTPPNGLENVLDVLPWDLDRPRRLLDLLDAWMPQAWADVPIAAGLLIGGEGTRAGEAMRRQRPGVASLLEATVATLATRIESIVLRGDGVVPRSCQSLPRLSDPIGVAGPLAGILAAHRWAPGSAWLFCPRDLPSLQSEAIDWLLAQRKPGRWVILPRSAGGLEALLAIYEPQARALLEQLLAVGALAPRLVIDHPKVATVAIPERLEDCWRSARPAARRGQSR
jgi:molybdopterin-guanine dinucleotide biosynthesis protein MobB